MSLKYTDGSSSRRQKDIFKTAMDCSNFDLHQAILGATFRRSWCPGIEEIPGGEWRQKSADPLEGWRCTCFISWERKGVELSYAMKQYHQ